MNGKRCPRVPFQRCRINLIIFFPPSVSNLFTCAGCIVVIRGGEAPSVFLFLNDLVSNRQHESPGEQLLCIVIRPGNHPSEAVTAFLSLLLTGSALSLLLLRISHLYICSVCLKRLYEHEQTSMEDMQSTSCIGPQWL